MIVGKRSLTSIGRCACLLLVSLLGCVIRADALTFSTTQDDSGRNILLIYDCNAPGFNRPGCVKHRAQFSGVVRDEDGRIVYRGDAAELDGILRSHSFSEIHIYSGGGNLDEG